MPNLGSCGGNSQTVSQAIYSLLVDDGSGNLTPIEFIQLTGPGTTIDSNGDVEPAMALPIPPILDKNFAYDSNKDITPV
jgi:hypothetical protein